MSLKDRSLRLLKDHQAWGLIRGPLPYRMLRYRLRTTSFEASDTDLLPQVARGDAPQGNEVPVLKPPQVAVLKRSGRSLAADSS
jgi:hypothetical protein